MQHVYCTLVQNALLKLLVRLVCQLLLGRADRRRRSIVIIVVQLCLLLLFSLKLLLLLLLFFIVLMLLLLLLLLCSYIFLRGETGLLHAGHAWLRLGLLIAMESRTGTHQVVEL